jgi:hypothetical protein
MGAGQTKRRNGTMQGVVPSAWGERRVAPPDVAPPRQPRPRPAPHSMQEPVAAGRGSRRGLRGRATSGKVNKAGADGSDDVVVMASAAGDPTGKLEQLKAMLQVGPSVGPALSHAHADEVSDGVLQPACLPAGT